ncbi:Vesicle-mediated ER to Golgi transport protein [Thecaphora frezii]
MLHGFDFLRQQYSQLAKPTGGQQSVVATLQTLAERLTEADKNDAPLEDRRAAVLALKGLSRDHTRLVGEKALPALLISLQRDAKDEELARALIECCITLCEVPPAGAEPNPRQAAVRRKQQPAGPPPGLANTDIFLSEPGPLHALLPLLAPDRAFYTRFASLQLLGSLLRNRPAKVQDHVLVAPGGCGAVLECLAEGAGSSAEIVRNEALLLLPHLVHGNADIQKLVAFEGAFEKLLDVCAVEGRIEGGVIVQDALEGLESLLRYNVSNQNLFRETLSIPMLAPLLFYPPPPPPNAGAFGEQQFAKQLEAFSFQDWDQQKLLNAKLVVGIIGMLIGGQGEGRKANQAALLQSGVTKCLAELALASTAPASLKAQSLHVLASLLRESRANQDQLSALHVFPVREVPREPAGEALDAAGDAATPLRPSGEYAPTPEPSYTRLPARPAVAALISTAVDGAGTAGGLGLRAAALACFEAYVADNVDARLGIISTMTSPPEDNPNEQNDDDRPFSAGSALLEGLIQNPVTDAAVRGSDAYKYLISAMAFTHLVRGSETVKQVARQIAITAEGQIVKRLPKEGDGDDEDDEDDDKASLIQAIVGNLTMAERELADAVRRERNGTLAAAAAADAPASLSFSAADWTRIMTGYLVVLSVWLFDSPLSVRDFLSESATLQALIQPVAQSSGIDPLIQALAAFVLGVAYEFDTNPGNVAVTRATMQPILLSRIGADSFAMRLERLKDDARFTEVSPDGLAKLAKLEEEREYREYRERERREARLAADAAAAAAAASAASAAGSAAPGAGAHEGQDAAAQQFKRREQEDEEDEEARDREMELSGMGHLSRRRKMGLWFEWSFVEFWRANSVLIQKTILVDPASSSSQLASSSAELLDAQRQLETARDALSKQGRDVEQLEKRLEEMTKMLKEERNVAATRIHELETEVGEAREELEEMKKKVERSEGEVKSKEETVEELERKVEEMVRKWKMKMEETEGRVERAEERWRESEEVWAKRVEDVRRKLSRATQSAGVESGREEEVERWKREVEQERQGRVEAQRKVREGEERIMALERRMEETRKELDEARGEVQRLGAAAAAAKGGGGKEVEDLKKEKEELAKENEDLLVLLEEVTGKRRRDKARLREVGCEVSEDEDEDEDEE